MSIPRKLKAWTVCGLALAFGMAIAAPAANAITLPLTVYNDNGVATDFTAELSITSTTGGLLLTFSNTSTGNALESAIDQIYLEAGFDDIFNTAVVDGTTGTVTFSQKTVNSGTKPQDSGTIGWTTTWAEGYFTRDGSKDDGINTGESLTLFLAFDGGQSLTPLQLAIRILNDPDFSAVAIHANACVDEPDTSCSAYATPIPGAIWLLASALLGLVGFGARRKAAA